MRLIDADALLKRKLKQIGWQPSDRKHDLYIELRDFVNQAPTISTAPDWTPCAEGLPGKETDNVLVCFLDKFGFMEVSIGWYWIPNEKWYTDAKSSPVDVIAWQPLPKPYNPDHIGDANKKVEEATK